MQMKKNERNVMTSPNALFIREIIDKTQSIQGERVIGKNQEDIKANVQAILKKQRQQVENNARTQTY